MSVDSPTSVRYRRLKSPQKALEFTASRRLVVYLFHVLMDRNSPSRQQGTIEQDQLGFLLEVDRAGPPLPCKLVRGFDEALEAARDPRIPMPSRLVIVHPEEPTLEWLASWSEDENQVRRTLRIRRCSDEMALIAVVTLAAFGYAIPTALTIESLTLPSQRRRIVRSGVHPKSFLSTIRAHYERSLQQNSANDVSSFPPDPLPEDGG